MTTLFSDYHLKGKTVKNRIVVPPMVRFYKGKNDGYVTEKNIAHYDALAKGGSGIIIVEAACVAESGKLHAVQLGVWDDKFIEGLSQIARAIHENGAICLLQIHHAGLKTCAESNPEPIAPSNFSHKSGNGREMTPAEIEQTKNQFVTGALRAERAGFDGVEIHGCHAYLISQFLSPAVNVRTDAYGEDKAKFASDIIQQVKQAVGGDFIVGIRTSGNDPDMKTSIAYAHAFERAGADYLHVSTGFTGKKPEDMAFPEDSPFTWIAQLGFEIKKNVSIPVIAVNGVKTPEQAKAIIENGLSDFVAVGRGHLADAEWANKTKRNLPVHPCLGCARCSCFINIDDCAARKKEPANGTIS